MMKLNGVAALLASAGAMAMAQPADAAELNCTVETSYKGAPLRSPLDLSALPADRAISREAMPKEKGDQLDETFDRLFAGTTASAASIAIWKPGTGYWMRTKNVAESGSEPASFWWASTGKLATATVILQLISERKLLPATPVAAFFPEFEQASSATVNDLLHHTSGIFTFNADLKLRERPGYKSPDDLIAVADNHPLDFCPGTNWNYSNTGYVMLARIAEKLEGETFADIVERRIAEPLGLQSFKVLQRDDPASAMVPLTPADADGIPEIASIFGAGSIVATPTDMLSFLHAYLEGGLVSRSTRDDAVTMLYPMFGTTMSYGTGIMVTDVPDQDAPTIWVGHSGGSPHAKALLIYDMKRDAYAAIALNNQAPAEGIANTLLKLLD